MTIYSSRERWNHVQEMKRRPHTQQDGMYVHNTAHQQRAKCVCWSMCISLLIRHIGIYLGTGAILSMKNKGSWNTARTQDCLLYVDGGLFVGAFFIIVLSNTTNLTDRGHAECFESNESGKYPGCQQLAFVRWMYCTKTSFCELGNQPRLDKFRPADPLLTMPKITTTARTAGIGLL